MRVGLFSMKLDLHVYAVAKCLRDRGVDVQIFLTDDYSKHGQISFRTGSGREHHAWLSSHDGRRVHARDLDIVWWRRVNQEQLWHPDSEDRDAVALINNEWRFSLAGIMAASFRGAWVNYPPNDVLAGNKLTQLWAAEDVGLKVPTTLVCNEKDAAVAFANEVGGRVIAKKIAGITPTPLATVEYQASELQEADNLSFSPCPVMLQELLVGTEHLRVHVFGDEVIAVKISSPHLDWRRDLSVPFSVAQLEKGLVKSIVELNRVLGLRMSIMDMKVVPGAKRLDRQSTVWIETNPQGQFLFAEALAGVDLAESFADFLVREAELSPKGPQTVPFLNTSQQFAEEGTSMQHPPL